MDQDSFEWGPNHHTRHAARGHPHLEINPSPSSSNRRKARDSLSLLEPVASMEKPAANSVSSTKPSPSLSNALKMPSRAKVRNARSPSDITPEGRDRVMHLSKPALDSWGSMGQKKKKGGKQEAADDGVRH